MIEECTLYVTWLTTKFDKLINGEIPCLYAITRVQSPSNFTYLLDEDVVGILSKFPIGFTEVKF